MGNVKIIAASAGSGKTYRLAYEYVKGVVCDPELYRHILAVTFTNKATEEMKSRILREIHLLASDAPSSYIVQLTEDLGFNEKKIRTRALQARKLILHDYSRFAVLTIDRFFQRLIRSFIRELGVEVNFTLQLDTDSLLGVAADRLIEDISSDEELRRQLFLVARDHVETNKRWNIKEPLLGLGKELFGEEYQRASDRRPADENTDSLIDAIVEKGESAGRQIAAVAMRALRIINENGLSAVDFKGKSRSLLPYLERVGKGAVEPLSNPALEALDSDDSWAHKDSANRGVVTSLIAQLRPLLQEIHDLYRDNSRLINSALLLRENHRNFILLADLQKRVEQICTQENIMPISETNRMISQLVTGNDTPFIFEKAGNHYSLFMIDEFQDTSSSQWDNFVPLLKNAISEGDGNPVMLIGDVKQAIYRWRGGDWRILSHRVHEEMGQERVDTETLETNYRSMRRVVEFNNAIVEHVTAADNAELNGVIAAALSKGSIDAAEAASLTDLMRQAYANHAQKTKNSVDEGLVTITVYGQNDQGEYIPPLIEKIEELQSRGYAPGDIAILVRLNSHGTSIARMLLAHKHAHPNSEYCYDVITQEALTVGSASVSQFIIACLTLAVNCGDSVKRAIYNRWLGRSFDSELSEDEHQFFSHTASLSPEEAFEEVVMRYDLQSHCTEIAYIQAVHEQINNFSTKYVADIPLFLKWWSEEGYNASITMQGGRGAITISTIHKSKGLQYEAVILPHVAWELSPGTDIVWAESAQEGLDGIGILPIRYKKEMADSFFAPKYYRELVMSHIDALNLFYVAVTRAEQELHMMISNDPRNKNRMGGVVRRVLREDENGVELGQQRGEMTRSDDGTEVISFGRPNIKPKKEQSENQGLRGYPTSRPGAKVKLRLPSARYFEQGDGELSPRDFGILMHKAFESADTQSDVQRALTRMLSDSKVSRAEYAQLLGLIAKSFANPLVAEWFGSGWDSVHNENDIVVPGDASVKRPDRVMIKGRSAVVVDYKFGRKESAAHAKQLLTYIDLLRGMGYAQTTGYIWYVSLDKIEQVK